jgi:hypothetical protein
MYANAAREYYTAGQKYFPSLLFQADVQNSRPTLALLEAIEIISFIFHFEKRKKEKNGN